MTALIVADCWKNFPLVALIALAALQAVPRDITAASLVDGAGAVRALPLRHPALSRRSADGGAGAAHDRGLQGVRHHLGDDARRAGQQHAHAVDPRLPGGVLVPARRLRRLAGADRDPDRDAFWRSPMQRWCARPRGVPPDGTQEPRLHHLHPPCRAAAGRGHPGAARLAVRHEHLAGRRPFRQAAALVAADGRFLALPVAAVDRGEQRRRRLHRVAAQQPDGRRHGDARRTCARHSRRLGGVAHARARLVAVAGDRHLHAAAGGACRAALHGPLPISACSTTCSAWRWSI